MFIRLTRRDGSPIWVNSNFIVTVESIKTGGAIVVPSGDGLDYEVRESADDIFALLGDDSVQEVPMGEPAAETKGEPGEKPAEEPAKASESAPVFEGADVPAAESEGETAAAVTAVMQLSPKAEPTAEKPSKRARKAKTRPVPAGTPATEGERKITRRRVARKTALTLTDEQLNKVRSMAPRSVKRLSNTLSTQFAVTEPETTIRAMVEHDIIQIDEQSHITWI